MRLGLWLAATTLSFGAANLYAADTTDNRGIPLEGGATVTNPGFSSSDGLGDAPDATEDIGIEAQGGAIDHSNFETVDANRDGYVDRQEAEAYRPLQESFGSLDRNGDEQLTAEEFNSYREIEER